MTRPYCCLDRSPPSPARVRRENLGQPRAGRPLSWAGSEPLPPTPTLRPAEMRRNLEDTQVALRGSADHLVVVDLRSEEHTSELQSLTNLVCRLLLEKKKKKKNINKTSNKTHPKHTTLSQHAGI